MRFCETSPQCFGGLRKWIKRKRKMSVHTAVEAYVSSIKNMAEADRILPTKALCQVKNLKPGLKFGADPIFSRKQARFITKNVI